MTKQQEINIVPSDSAMLFTLDGLLDGVMGYPFLFWYEVGF
jgi:hypothetical protein